VANYTLKEGGDYEATCIVCVDTGRVRVVYVDKRVTKDVDGVLINLGETYTGQEIWKPEVVRLSCADAADQATSIAEIAYTMYKIFCRFYTKVYNPADFESLQVDVTESMA
jgi:hypothetical protein